MDMEKALMTIFQYFISYVDGLVFCKEGLRNQYD